MSDEKMEQGTVQIALRIAPDLRERIKQAADANNRSVNKELTATLEEKYPAPRYDIERLPEIISEMRHCIAIIEDPSIDPERKLEARASLRKLDDEFRAMGSLKG